MNDERSSGKQASAGSLAQEAPRLWHWERQGGFQELCTDSRGMSQGLPWYFILYSCIQKAVGWVLCPANSAWSLLLEVTGWEPQRCTLVFGQAEGRDFSEIQQREELYRRGWGNSYTPVVCNFPAAALVLCPEVQQGVISGPSPFRSCIQSTWGFPLWFHSDNSALESRGLSCRHREMCRIQQQLCWDGCDTCSTCQSLHPALGSRSQQQSKKGHKAPKLQVGVQLCNMVCCSFCLLPVALTGCFSWGMLAPAPLDGDHPTSKHSYA